MNNKKAFVAISDFHSYKYPLSKINDYYLDEYEVIYILGDATDRGEDNKGTGGIDLLLEIKSLTEQYPGRVIYIPGNHDEFIIGSVIGNNKDNYVRTLIANGGKQTYDDMCMLHRKDKLLELIEWLGKLPIQRTCVTDEQRYVFAHALFNQRLYDINPNYCLYDYIKETDYEMKKMVENVLWYRKGEFGAFKASEMAKDAVMVIGHTAACHQQANLNLEDADGNEIQVYCVDGGIAYNGKMLKYVSGEKKVFGTMKNSHQPPKFKDISAPKEPQKIPVVSQKTKEIFDETSRLILPRDGVKKTLNTRRWREVSKKNVESVFFNSSQDSLQFKIVNDVVGQVSSWKHSGVLATLKDIKNSIKEPWFCCAKPLNDYIKSSYYIYKTSHKDNYEFWFYQGTDRFSYYNSDPLVCYSDYVKIVLFDYLIYSLISKHDLSVAICNCENFFFGTDSDIVSVNDSKTGKLNNMPSNKKKYDYSCFTRDGNSRKIAIYLGVSGMRRVLELHGCASPYEYIKNKLSSNRIMLVNEDVKKRIR